MASKRSHKTLTLAEKESILLELDKGISGKELAEKYGVGTSTISDIKKNKKKLLSYIANCVEPLTERKVLRKPQYAKMEEKLYKWFLLQRKRNITVTANIVRKKAVEIHSKCYKNKTFTASHGWLNSFKKRYGLPVLKVVRAKLSDDSSVVEVDSEMPKVKHEDAIESFSICVQWAEENEIELEGLTLLRTLQQLAIEEDNQECIRKIKVTDFFK